MDEIKDCLFDYNFLNFEINGKWLGDDSEMSWRDDNEMEDRWMWGDNEIT